MLSGPAGASQNETRKYRRGTGCARSRPRDAGESELRCGLRRAKKTRPFEGAGL